MNPAVCDYCIKPNVDYTFSVAAVLEDSQLGPAATVNQAVGERPTPSPPGPTENRKRLDEPANRVIYSFV